MSISGGRSSVMLAKLLVDKEKLIEQEVWLGGFYLYTKYVNETSEYIFVFCNTSRERKATYLFMRDVEIHWGLKVTWLEAVIDPRQNKGTKHKVVTFDTACTDGSVFEAVIAKYGIPNVAYLHCTRELKTVVARSFMRYIGWGDYKKYITIIGYRADEPKRNGDQKAKDLSQWYPLKHWGIRKPDVAYFWNRQSFDLGMYEPKGEEFVDADGNCEACYKKHDLKIIYQAKKDPESIGWIRRMEAKYKHKTNNKEKQGQTFYFFRHNRTLDDILEQYPEIYNLSLAEIRDLLNDKSLLEDGANFDLLEQEDCAESCEAFSEE